MEESENFVKIIFSTESERQQILVVLEALAIFSNKNQQYQDGWQAYGSYGAAFFVKDRANRLWKSMKYRSRIKYEDALDLINLSCFLIRSQRAGNTGGEYWGKGELPGSSGDLVDPHHRLFPVDSV